MSSTPRDSLDVVMPMRMVSSALQQLKQVLPLLVTIYVPTLLVIGALVVVTLKTDIPLRVFFIDTVTEFNAPMYIGLISNLGVLLWCVSATVCLFGGWLLLTGTKHLDTALFLISAGLISALLMFDDLYLLHEELLPERLGIPQPLVFVGYGGLVLAFLVRFRQVILGTTFILLLVAFGCFATSVFVDLFVTPEEFLIAGGYPGRHLIEDGFKMLGIVTWATYFVATCVQTVGPTVRSA